MVYAWSTAKGHIRAQQNVFPPPQVNILDPEGRIYNVHEFQTHPLRAAALASCPRTSCSCSCEEAAAAVVVDTIVREVADVAVVELPAIAIWAEGATTDSQGEHKGQLTRIQCPSFIISLL